MYGQMNEPPGARARVALTGLTVAEYFRDEEGQDVLLFIDNIFRFTQAGSEVCTVLHLGIIVKIDSCPLPSTFLMPVLRKRLIRMYQLRICFMVTCLCEIFKSNGKMLRKLLHQHGSLSWTKNCLR